MKAQILDFLIAEAEMKIKQSSETSEMNKELLKQYKQAKEALNGTTND